MPKIIANTSLEVEADYDDSSSFIRIGLKIKKKHARHRGCFISINVKNLLRKKYTNVKNVKNKKNV